MSTSGVPCLMKGGRSVKPRTGAVTMPPIRAPRPSVDASRNTERGYLMTSPSPGSAIGVPPFGAVGGGGSGSGSGAAAPRKPLVTSRIQRKPKIAARTAPTATTIGSRIRPTKMQTMPMANPTGQMVGVGSCGVP